MMFYVGFWVCRSDESKLKNRLVFEFLGSDVEPLIGPSPKGGFGSGPHTPFRDRSSICVAAMVAHAVIQLPAVPTWLWGVFLCVAWQPLGPLVWMIADPWFGWFACSEDMTFSCLFRRETPPVPWGALVVLNAMKWCPWEDLSLNRPSQLSPIHWLSILRTLSPGLDFFLVGSFLRNIQRSSTSVARYYQTAWPLWVWWRKKWCTCRTRRPGRQLVVERDMMPWGTVPGCLGFTWDPNVGRLGEHPKWHEHQKSNSKKDQTKHIYDQKITVRSDQCHEIFPNPAVCAEVSFDFLGKPVFLSGKFCSLWVNLLEV